MNDCCSTDRPPINLRKCRCPVNGREYSEVSIRTIVHHIKDPWHWDSKGHRYFFCDDSRCEVAYFADDGSVILKAQLRTREQFPDALVCYCFGVTKTGAKDPRAKAFVVQQTSQGQCSCVTSNPSGRCCLADFPKKRGRIALPLNQP